MTGGEREEERRKELQRPTEQRATRSKYIAAEERSKHFSQQARRRAP